MSKSKNDPYEFNQRKILFLLQEAFDRIEGQHSNIPGCCIQEYAGIDGTTYGDLKDNLECDNQKALLKKLKKFNYVPCMNCLENKEPNELKLNGISDLGQIIRAVMDIVKYKEKSDARKTNRRSKK